MKAASVCCLLLLLLGIMFSATHASRNSGWMEKQVAFSQIHFQDETDITSDKENMVIIESTTRRSDLEDMDYGGTGANDRHDPKTPGPP